MSDAETGMENFQQENEQSEVSKDKNEKWCRSFFQRNAFMVCVAVGVATGFGLGFALRSLDISADARMWLALPGDIFMRMLKMTIIPLIVGSIINGAATSDPKSNGRISLLTFGFILISNFLGAVLGIVVYLIFKPGHDIVETISESSTNPDSHHLQTQDMFADLIRNLVPDNIVTATFQKTQTRYNVVTSVAESNGTNVTIQVFKRDIGVASGTNLLGIIFISTVVGIAASTVKDSSVSFIPFFKATSDIFIRVMRWFIWSTPIGVASLICVSIVEVENIQDTFRSLGIFVLAFTVGIIVQQLVIIPIVYTVVLRQNPAKFLLSAARPWIAAFGPPSTAIAIPEMINVSENVHHIDTRVSRFVIPFGAALSRPGSCFFISLAALFVIALSGIHPTLYDILLIGLLTTLGSLAISSIPSASVVTVILILASIDKNSSNVGLLMALEWYTDRLRTSSNVLHIVTCSTVINKLCSLKTKVHTSINV